MIEGIRSIELGVTDFPSSDKFLNDFGLTKNSDGNFSTLDNSTVKITTSETSRLLAITWGIQKDFLNKFYESSIEKSIPVEWSCDGRSITCLDPSDVKLVFEYFDRTLVVKKSIPVNGYSSPARIDLPVPSIERVSPIEISHLVLETKDLYLSEKFYTSLGFIVTDRLIGRGVFLRCKQFTGHHDIFLIQSNENRLHHIAFTMSDIYELFAGGQQMNRCGWNTAKGPGRHNIASSFYWYFYSPMGTMVEYSSNEDVCTDRWIPRNIEYDPGVIASENFI